MTRSFTARHLHSSLLTHLAHLGIWVVAFFGLSLGLIRSEGSDFGPVEVELGAHCTWPGSVTTGTLSVEHIGVKVSIKRLRSLLPFEPIVDDQYDDEDGNGTSDDTTSDGSHVGA